MAGDAGSRTQDTSHAKRTLFHWTTSPRMIAFEISFQKLYLQHISKKILWLECCFLKPRTFRMWSERSTTELHIHGWLLRKSLFRNLIYKIDRRKLHEWRRMQSNSGHSKIDFIGNVSSEIFFYNIDRRKKLSWRSNPGHFACEANALPLSYVPKDDCFRNLFSETLSTI